jgi:hypothetical protein
VKLKVIPDWPGLQLAGFFRPSNADFLREGPPRPPPPPIPSNAPLGDTDLGSGGPLLLPGRRLIGGGKQGRYYVLDADTMHLVQDTTSPDPVHIEEGFQAFLNTHNPEFTQLDYASGEEFGPNIHGGPVFWQAIGFVYKMAEKDFLKAFRYDPLTRTVQQQPVATASVRPPAGMPGGFSSISANGDHDGILWTLLPNANAQAAKAPGTLIAFDAKTLIELWRDPIPETFAKFCPPTIADGKVIRVTFANDGLPGYPGKVVV